MRRNKSSIVYQYLPHNWVSYSDGELRGSYSMKVNYWSWKEMEDIYEKRLNQQIQRKLVVFRNAGGDTSEFGNVNKSTFKYVQIDPKEGFAAIKGTISPLVFYCSGCGFTKSFRRFPHDSSALVCPKCKKKMKQLQLLYSCPCGNATPVYISNNQNKIYKFKPVANDPKSNFRFTVVENGHERIKEMTHKCECGQIRYPLNAFDGRNYKPHSITTVNLIDKKEGNLLQFGSKAEKLQIGRWLELLTEEEYKKILNEPNQYFVSEKSEEEIEEKIKVLLQYVPGMTEELARATIMNSPNESNLYNKLNELIIEIDSHVSLASNQVLSEELIEYFTVKHPLRKMGLSEAIKKMISIDSIYDESEINALHKSMGISNVQISYDTEIITSTYGYTRVYSDPTRLTDGKLKLKSFTQKNEINMLAYSNKLKTEGLLIEFDRRKILLWLQENGIIRNDELPPHNKEKEWFLKMINSEIIECFGEIEDSDENRVTKNVYGLIHTMSHMMIRAAGEISGLSKDSLSEIIFPNIPAVFIYANTSQAIPLGSLSSMFEMNYKDFLDKSLEVAKDCIFDPLCSNDKGACSGCTYLSEVSCSNFNSDLSRFYLIGTPDTHDKIKMKGFWM